MALATGSVAMTERNPVDLTLGCKALSNYPLFSSLTAGDILVLAKSGSEIHYSTGETITKEDDYIDCFFIIVSGHVEVIQKKIIVATLGESEAIGLTHKGIFSSTGRRMATTIALTNCICLRFEWN